MYIGQRTTNPFFRTEEIIPKSVEKNANVIKFKARPVDGNKEYNYTITRQTLDVFMSYYNSVIKREDTTRYSCQLMDDADFISTMKYDMERNPNKPAETPQKSTNKI